MVGIVIVSHSARLAEGVAELAVQTAGPDVRIGAAGGLDEPEGALGTDAAKVLRAIEEVWSGDGVLVLMDLGSAVLSAELAVDLLDEERRAAVLLTEAPLVEGAVAAAVAAGLGDPLGAVVAAARRSLAGKEEHLAPGPTEEEAPGGASRALGMASGAPDADFAAPGVTAAAPGAAAGRTRMRVRNALGLHARPAALLVRTAAGFDAAVTVADATNGRGPVSARSLNGVATLGARQDDELVVVAEGPQAAEALAAIRRSRTRASANRRSRGPERPPHRPTATKEPWKALR